MIHYLGFYYSLNSDCRKNVSPAAITKMNYVSKKLSEATCGQVRIFGLGSSSGKTIKFYSGSHYKLCDNVRVSESATLGRKNFFFRMLDFLFSHFQLIKYMFCEIKGGDIVVVYHSLFYKYDILFFRLFRNNKIIMEVEELFSAAWNKKDFKKEINYLSRFDAYIYVNDIMNKKFGFNKPFAVCYGNYDISPNYRDRKELKKLIYAGVLGKEGSDVDLAIDVMQYLPDNYDLKIAGYGRHDEVIYINNKISDKRNIEFVGFLSGEEYEDFLSKGDVGLCTRVLPNELSDYTFPSKVLVYLSHGLVPLCPSIDCLKKSSVSKTIIFYEESAPESIAKALMQEVKDSSTVRIIKTLDNNFIYSLSAIIECLKSEN